MKEKFEVFVQDPPTPDGCPLNEEVYCLNTENDDDDDDDDDDDFKLTDVYLDVTNSSSCTP